VKAFPLVKVDVSTSSTRSTLARSSCISSVASSTRCGRRPHIGSWAPCPMTLPSWLISPDSVRADCFSSWHKMTFSPRQTSPSSPLVLPAPGVQMEKASRKCRKLKQPFTPHHNRSFPSYMNIFISTWVILVSGLVFALPMIYLRVTNTTDPEDETLFVIPLDIFVQT